MESRENWHFVWSWGTEAERFMIKKVCQIPIGTIYTQGFAHAFPVEIAFYTQDPALIIPTLSLPHAQSGLGDRKSINSQSLSSSTAARIERPQTRGQMLKTEAPSSYQKLPEESAAQA